jgi:hypothetical protein
MALIRKKTVKFKEGVREFITRERTLPASESSTKNINVLNDFKAKNKKLIFDDRGSLLTAENSVSINIVPFVTTTLSVEVLQQNPYRKYLLIQNNGVDFIVINFTNAASIANGLKLPSGGVYEMLRPSLQAINIIGNVAGLNVIILEGT